jgi:hypothetical protein
MGDLVTRCKRRADKENDEHISGAEWKSLIEETYGELWSIVSDTGLRYFETTTDVVTTGADSYEEPADHHKTLLITRVDGDGREFTLSEAMHQEEASLRGSVGEARCWSLVDDQLFLFPNPASGTYRWYYLQQPTNVSGFADGEVVDVVSYHGLAFLVWGVTVKALSKSESDVRLALAEREAARERLMHDAANRSIEARRRIVDDDEDHVYRAPGWWDR